MAGRPASGEQALELRLKGLLLGRLGLAVVGIFVTLLTRRAETGSVPPYYVLLSACLLNLGYLVLARAGVGPRGLGAAQLVLDVLLVGALVYLTGIDRFFAFFFFANVITSALVLGPRMAVAVASLASICMAAISTLYFLAGSDVALRLPFVDPLLILTYSTNLSFILPFLFFFALALHFVAFLSGRFTAEVSRVRILNEEILQNMAGGVLAADHGGQVQFVNAQAARLLGLRDPESVRGRQAEAVLPRPVSDLLRRAMAGHERLQEDFRLNGATLHVAVSRLADGAGGPVRGAVAVLSDESLRSQVEEMTRRAERFRAMLEMSAGMAHEIRNPLASIRGAAQELSGGTLSSDEDRTLLQVVIRESDRLNQIISEFLDYASDRPPDLALFDLVPLLEETAVLLETRSDRRAQVRREFPKSVLCRGERDKLKQVFLNLGLNALDACAHGAEPGHVLLRCQTASAPGGRGRQGVAVEILDDGGGIPKEDLPRVFDPFFTTKSHGTGMGLAIARKIVQAHEGDITLESEAGKGTRARVWLPS